MKKRKNIVHTSCPNYNTKMSKNVKRFKYVEKNAYEEYFEQF